MFFFFQFVGVILEYAKHKHSVYILHPITTTCCTTHLFLCALACAFYGSFRKHLNHDDLINLYGNVIELNAGIL